MTWHKNDPDWHYDIQRRWEVGGHEVILTRMRGKKGTDRSPSHLMLLCEGDGCRSHVLSNAPEAAEWDPTRPEQHDTHRCRAKAVARHGFTLEKRFEHGVAWRTMGLDAAVMDIFTRVSAGEWLGQQYGESIYVQEVAVLLDEKAPTTDHGPHGLPWPKGADEVFAACERLRGAEKLQLNGMILTEYERRFRWPALLESVIFRFVGDPLGYPNGDAGMIAYYESGERAGALLGTDDAKTIFPEWPEIDPLFAAAAIDAAAAHLDDERIARAELRVTRPMLRKRIRTAAPTLAEPTLGALSFFAKQMVILAHDRHELYAAFAQADNERRKKEKKRPKRHDPFLESLEDSIRDLHAWRDHLRKPASRNGNVRS